MTGLFSREKTKMTPEYFDIHSHFNLPGEENEPEKAVAEMRKRNVWAVAVGVNKETSEAEVRTAEKFPEVFATVGVHPDDAAEGFAEKFFGELAKSPKVVAVGECGLDYFASPKHVSCEGGLTDEKSIKKLQKEIFEKQIHFAVSCGKPLIIHCRSSKKSQDAYEDVLDILKPLLKKYGEKIKGDMHFFAGNLETAKKFLDIGFSLSFTGVITFASDYDEAVSYAPLERIMSETDAPFVAPVPYRGKKCEQWHVIEVVKRLAEIKQIPLETCKKAVVSNALKFYKLV